MENTVFEYRKLTRMTVGIKTQEDYNLQTLRGKVLINENDRQILFIQNPPQGPRSVEVGRTPHARFVRRPDGSYTVTFRFKGNELNLRQILLREMRVMSKMILAENEGRAL